MQTNLKAIKPAFSIAACLFGLAVSLSCGTIHCAAQSSIHTSNHWIAPAVTSRAHAKLRSISTQLQSTARQHQPLLAEILKAQISIGDIDGAVETRRAITDSEKSSKLKRILSSIDRPEEVIRFLNRPEYKSISWRREKIDELVFQQIEPLFDEEPVRFNEIQGLLKQMGPMNFDRRRFRSNAAKKAQTRLLYAHYKYGELKSVADRVKQIEDPTLGFQIAKSILWKDYQSPKFVERAEMFLEFLDSDDLRVSYPTIALKSARYRKEYQRVATVLTNLEYAERFQPQVVLEHCIWLCQSKQPNLATRVLEHWREPIDATAQSGLTRIQSLCRLAQIDCFLDDFESAESKFRSVQETLDRMGPRSHEFLKTQRDFLSCISRLAEHGIDLFDSLTSIKDPGLLLEALIHWIGAPQKNRSPIQVSIATERAMELLEQLPRGEIQSCETLRLITVVPSDMAYEIIERAKLLCMDPHYRGDFLVAMTEQAIQNGANIRVFQRLAKQFDEIEGAMYHRDSARSRFASILMEADMVEPALEAYKKVEFVDCVPWAFGQCIAELAERNLVDTIPQLFEAEKDYQIVKLINNCESLKHNQAVIAHLKHALEQRKSELHDASASELARMATILDLDIAETESLSYRLHRNNQTAKAFRQWADEYVNATDLDVLQSQISKVRMGHFRDVVERAFVARIAKDKPNAAWQSIDDSMPARQQASRLLGILDAH